MPRRRRGGQQGNANARKHGFYADALGPKARKVLKRAQRIDPSELEEEIALMRTKIHQLVDNDPDNISVLTLAGGLLVRMVALHHGLTDEQESGIHESFKALLTSLAPASR